MHVCGISTLLTCQYNLVPRRTSNLVKYCMHAICIESYFNCVLVCIYKLVALLIFSMPMLYAMMMSHIFMLGGYTGQTGQQTALKEWQSSELCEKHCTHK